MTAVHQFIPSFVPRDAIGAHSLQARAVLRGMGIRSEFYVADAGPELASLARPYDSYRPRPGDWILYQASTGSKLADWVLGRPEPKILNYHNVTPAATFERWEPRLADEVAEGRRQVAKLASVTSFAIAVSRYNETELVDMGYRNTAVVPLLIDLAGFEREVDRPTLDWLDRSRRAGGANVLFVGRIVPNKAQHDLVKALFAYRRVYDPAARLYLVGGASSGAYLDALKGFIGRLGLREAIDLAGSVSNSELAAYYKGADVFVCLSDHEGFCVPLLEAMHNEVPIVAYGSSAIPETLGDAGLVLPDKRPSTVAAAVATVLADAGLRRRLVEAGRRRLAEFSLDRSRRRFAAAIEQALSSRAAP